MPDIPLAHLTVLNLPPPEMISLAGPDGVGPSTGPQPENRANPPVSWSADKLRESLRSAKSKRKHAPIPSHLETDCDLLVIGSGAGGLVGRGDRRLARPEGHRRGEGTGARRHHGLVRRLDVGAAATRSRSAPGSSRTRRRRAPICAHVLGNNFDEARVEAFLEAAPRMVAFFETHTALQFEGAPRSPTPTAKCPAPAPAAARSSPRPTTRAAWGISSIGCASRCAKRRSWA